MRVRASLFGLGAVGLALALAACGETTPQEVQQRTAPIVTRVVKEVQGSLAAAQEMSEVKQLLEGLEILIPGLADDDTLKADWDSGMSDEEIAAKINETLAEYVFTEANVERASSDRVTFLLRGSVVCGAVKVEECTDSVGGGELQCTTRQEVSPECIEVVDDLELRIKATLVGSDGVDLGFSIGGSGSVVTLELRPDRVTVLLSLEGASAAARRVAQIVGEEIELPRTMKGLLAASLVINGPGDISLQSAVKQAVHVEGNSSEGGYQLRIEARDPVAELRLRQSPASITVGMDWGALDIVLPARVVWEQASETLELALKGMSASLASDGSGGITIKGVGLGSGTSKLTLGGKSLVEVDLNPSNGRQLDLSVTPWQDGLPRCEVSPLLDLRVKINLEPIAPYLDQPLEPWSRNEVFTVKLAAGSGSPAVAPVRQTASFDGGIMVLAGQLTLQSQVQPATITVPQGSCLTWHDALAGSHPLLGHFASGPCN